MPGKARPFQTGRLRASGWQSSGLPAAAGGRLTEARLPEKPFSPDPRPPRDGRAPCSTAAPTCDRVRSPIRCQAWTLATASTSRYVKTPTYLTLKRHEEKWLQQGTEQGRCQGRPRPADHTHPTAQEQATPVSISQNHQLREKGLGSKQKSKAGNGSRNIAREGTFLRAPGVGWPSQASRREKRTLISQISVPAELFFLARTFSQLV